MPPSCRRPVRLERVFRVARPHVDHREIHESTEGFLSGPLLHLRAAQRGRR
jgi:hypothetical protein